MPISKPHNIILRIIAVVLIATFLAQDFVWANPDIVSSASSSTLAPQPSVRSPEFELRAKTKFVEELIESNSSVPLASLQVEGIIAILGKKSDWLTSQNITYEISADHSEVIISLPADDLALRYYDPSLLRMREGYEEKHYEQLGAMDKQILLRTGPVAAPQTIQTERPVQKAEEPRRDPAQEVRAVDLYRTKVQALLERWHIFEKQAETRRKALVAINRKWYRFFADKLADKEKQDKKLRQKLAQLNGLLAIIDRDRQRGDIFAPGHQAEAQTRLEYMRLNAQEILIRLNALSCAVGPLAKYTEVCNRIDETLRHDLAVFIRDGHSILNFSHGSIVLKGIARLERRGGGIIDATPGHAIPYEARLALLELAEMVDGLAEQAALVNYEQPDLPRFDQAAAADVAPEGAAVEARKMEAAALVGILAVIVGSAANFFHVGAISSSVTAAYIILMIFVPILTARQIESALRYKNPRVFKLIRPLRKANDIRTLYAHDPDSRDKISYYSYSLERGKNAHMSQLFIETEAMAHMSPIAQWIVYLHEWLHGRVRVKTEMLNVPLTYCLPAIVGISTIVPIAISLGLWHDVAVLSGLLAYNVAVLIVSRVVAGMLPSRISPAGHRLLAHEYWKPYTDKELDEAIADYAHESTFDSATGCVMPVGEWLGGVNYKGVEVIPIDPASAEASRPEEIVVVKADYLRSLIGNSSKSVAKDALAAVKAAVKNSPKRSFRFVVALSDPPQHKDDIRDWIMDTKAALKNIKSTAKWAKPGARIRFDIRATGCDITRLRDLEKFYRRRQEHIVKNLIETEAVGCEVHGNVDDLAKLTGWLRDNGYPILVLLGDYLSKDKDKGFVALDFLMDHLRGWDKPDLNLLIGRSEYAFLLSVLGDPIWTKRWPKLPTMEGPAVLEGLRALAAKEATAEMPKHVREDIEAAKEFEAFVKSCAENGMGGMDVWYRLHPKVIQLVEFIVENMDVCVEDEHHNIYTIGSRSDVEQFEWRGLRGVEALFMLQSEFKKQARERLDALRYISGELGRGCSAANAGGMLREMDAHDANIDGYKWMDGPFSERYRDAFFEKLIDYDTPEQYPKTRAERYEVRKRQIRLNGVNTTINLSVFTAGVRKANGWPKGTQNMEQGRIFDGTGRMKLVSIPTLGSGSPDECLLMTDKTENEIPDGVSEGMSLESTTKDKLEIVTDILTPYKPIIASANGTWLTHIIDGVQYYLSQMFLGMIDRIKLSSPVTDEEVRRSIEEAEGSGDEHVQIFDEHGRPAFRIRMAEFRTAALSRSGIMPRHSSGGRVEWISAPWSGGVTRFTRTSTKHSDAEQPKHVAVKSDLVVEGLPPPDARAIVAGAATMKPVADTVSTAVPQTQDAEKELANLTRTVRNAKERFVDSMHAEQGGCVSRNGRLAWMLMHRPDLKVLIARKYAEEPQTHTFLIVEVLLTGRRYLVDIYPAGAILNQELVVIPVEEAARLSGFYTGYVMLNPDKVGAIEKYLGLDFSKIHQTKIPKERWIGYASPAGSIAEGLKTIERYFRAKEFTFKEFRSKRMKPGTKELFSRTTARSEINGLVALGVLIPDKTSLAYRYKLNSAYARAPPVFKRNIRAIIKGLPARPDKDKLSVAGSSIKQLLAPLEASKDDEIALEAALREFISLFRENAGNIRRCFKENKYDDVVKYADTILSYIYMKFKPFKIDNINRHIQDSFQEVAAIKMLGGNPSGDNAWAFTSIDKMEEILDELEKLVSVERVADQGGVSIKDLRMKVLMALGSASAVELFGLDLPSSTAKDEFELAFDEIKSFIVRTKNLLGGKESTVEDVLDELVISIMGHGKGGVIKVYVKDGKMLIAAKDNGPGLSVAPDELIIRSIEANVEMGRESRISGDSSEIQGIDFYRIALDPDSVMIEFNKKKFVRDDANENGWFIESGTNDVVPGTRFTLEFSLAEASNKEFLRKLPSKAADVQCRKDVIDRPIADKERIILSESLFTVAGDDLEIGDIKRALGSILNKPGSHIEILPADEIMRCVRRDGSASRDKVAVILSSEDTKPGSAWRDAGKTESIKATVLTVGDKLTGANYLYLTGLIGFTRAVMAGERNKIERYYKLLTGTVMEVNALALLDIAVSNNTIPFALNTILKFRPIEKIDPAVLDSLRLAMENFLISA